MEYLVEHIWVFLGICLLILNVFGFIQFGVDKKWAQKGKWRISEASLFATALLGGSIGCIVGMKVFRHKTKHKSFIIGMPLILLLQIIAVVLVLQLI